ncbi:MAG: HAMP domain-containing protein [Candidatus Schekmanbacteria bacterium]|nr:HAMP domain-containing protein [Candidatus Schekmanbacteria bacterium]
MKISDLKRRFYNSLSFKLTLLMGITLLLVFVFSTSIIVKFYFAEAKSKILSTASFVAMLINNNLRHDMLINDREGINNFFNDISKLEDLVNASIMDDQGIIKFSTKKNAIGMKISIDVLRQYTNTKEHFEYKHTEGESVWSNFYEIRGTPECYQCHNRSKKIIGYLSVDFSSKKIDEMVAREKYVMIITAFVSMGFISFALFLFNHYFVYKPVKKLHRLIEGVKAGNLDVKERFDRRDEIGGLGRDFNLMVKELKDARISLEENQKKILAQSEKLASLGQLASGIAHEIQNPLAGISGALRVIHSEYLSQHTDQELKDIIDKILSQIDRLSKTTKDILSFARPSVPMFVPTNINSVIEKSLFFARQNAKNNGVDIREELSNDIPETKADSELLKQVFLNIMLNGIQSMPEGGTLTVSSDMGDGGVSIVVSVSDTGCGIPKDKLKNIFNPFFTTKHQGTGLGLYIVKDIVDSHNGRIEVESNNSKGSIFKVYIPVIQDLS